MQKSGIYSLNWESGYFYIGQSQDVKERWRQHKKSFKDKKMLTHQPKLGRVWKKYGEPELKIIISCPLEQLNYLEQHFIDLYWGNKLLCNTSPSARNNRGVKKTKPPYFKGKKLPKEMREKISKSRIGKYGKEKHPRNIFTVEDSIKIIEFHKNGMSGRKIAKKLMVSKSLIYNIISGNHWTVMS